MRQRAVYPLSVWITWVLLVPLALIALGFAIVASTDAKELVLDRPRLWWLGGAAPLAALIFLYGVVRRRRALHQFVSGGLSSRLARHVSPGRQAVRAALVVIAILMVAAGVIGPRWGTYLEKQRTYGVDAVVALDVSRSMLANDIRPNRIERAKREIRQQIAERAAFQHAGRLALLVFAGSTSLRLPLTTDHFAFRTKLDQIDVGSAPRGGTAIGEAIRAASELFARSPAEATKVILLFSDGEDHEGDPVGAARTAFEENGIRVFTVGVGDASSSVGAQVPLGDGTGKPLLHDGQIVFSKLDVSGLRRIADAGGGTFFPVVDMHRLVDRIGQMHKAELTIEERVRHQPRYQWFIAAALLLLGIQTMTSESPRTEAEGVSMPRIWARPAGEAAT